MYKITEKVALNPTVTKMVIEAPLIAKKAKPGQFIIVRPFEDSERIPLTVAGYDREKGTVTIIGTPKYNQPLTATVTNLTPAGAKLTYQWYHDGEQIENATEKSYAITADSKDTCGIYSVTVTTPSGIAKTVEVCEVADVILQPVQPVSGDINQDGTADLADVILLQKYLLAQSSLTQEQTQLADLQSDDTINGFDLALLRTSCLSAES